MSEGHDRPLLGTDSESNRDRTLASLAFINVTWDEKKASYLDNFTPYALEALRSVGEGDAAQVSEFVAARFGLDFPTNVSRALLERARKQGSVARIPRQERYELADGVAARLPDVTSKARDHQREQNYLVKGLVAHAREHFDLNWADDVAADHLVAFIENRAVPLLTGARNGGPVPEGEGASYVVAHYVAAIFDADPTAFGYLDGMIKGSMLASVLYVDSTAQVSRRFKETTLYLDTAVCLRALGHEGAEAALAATQMLGLAQRQGANLACFSHNVREMRGVLEGARNALARARGAETALRGVATHFRSIDASPNDIDLVIATLETDLAALRIFVQPTPSFEDERWVVNEGELEEVLQRCVGYQHERTRLPDVLSLTAINRLRHGASGPHLETCRAVLVTTNSSLVRGSREFFNSGRHEWPLAMVDFALSTLLWVKEPSSAPDLPRQQIIADCLAALSPSPRLWAKIVEEIERLESRNAIPAETVAMLRYSRQAQVAIMDVTFGDPARVTDATIPKALAKAQEQMTAKDRSAAIEATARAEGAEAAEAVSRFEAEMNAQHADELKARVAALEAAESKRREVTLARIKKKTDKVEKAVRRGALPLLIVGAVAAGLAFYPEISADWSAWAREPLRAAGCIATIAGVLALATRGNLHTALEKWSEGAYERALEDEGL